MSLFGPIVEQQVGRMGCIAGSVPFAAGDREIREKQSIPGAMVELE
jgi:hypothetical protein